MKPIQYIGKKESKTDNVAGTGTIWPEPGAVREVPDNAADKLLMHPDVWKLAPAVVKTGKKSEEKLSDGSGGDGDGNGTHEPGDQNESKEEISELQVSDLAPLIDINAMDGAQLREYAQRQFGHNFHHKTGEAKMRDTIVGLMNRG